LEPGIPEQNGHHGSDVGHEADQRHLPLVESVSDEAVERRQQQNDDENRDRRVEVRKPQGELTRMGKQFPARGKENHPVDTDDEEGDGYRRPGRQFSNGVLKDSADDHEQPGSPPVI